MGLIVLEAAVALAISIFGVECTMFPSIEEAPPLPEPDPPGAAPGQALQDDALGGQKKDMG